MPAKASGDSFSAEVHWGSPVCCFSDAQGDRGSTAAPLPDVLGMSRLPAGPEMPVFPSSSLDCQERQILLFLWHWLGKQTCSSGIIAKRGGIKSLTCAIYTFLLRKHNLSSALTGNSVFIAGNGQFYLRHEPLERWRRNSSHILLLPFKTTGHIIYTFLLQEYVFFFKMAKFRSCPLLLIGRLQELRCWEDRTILWRVFSVSCEGREALPGKGRWSAPVWLQTS